MIPAAMTKTIKIQVIIDIDFLNPRFCNHLNSGKNNIANSAAKTTGTKNDLPK
jgi:hypothetical protein